jgi:hypothetical protein
MLDESQQSDGSDIHGDDFSKPLTFDVKEDHW